MPSKPIHQFLTRKSMELLLPAHRAWIQEEEEPLGSDYCMFPDRYYSDPSVSPYLCFVEGIPFHYIRNETVEYNNWSVRQGASGMELIPDPPLQENLHHRDCRKGFSFYFTQISEALSKGAKKDLAKFLGALCHVLQDNTIPIHALEGSDGVDIFVLDRLIAPSPEHPYAVPSMILAAEVVDLGELCYVPRLLGATVEEAAFHAYSRFCKAVAENRFRILPLVRSIQANDCEETEKLWKEIYRTTLQCSADFLYTAFSIGLNQFDSEKLKELQKIPLEEVRAVRRPRYLSAPYRFTPFVVGGCLNASRERVDLELQWDEGRRKYARGWGMGAHAWFAFDYDLPKDCFRRLTGALGLHPDLGAKGHVKMRWLHNGRSVWETDLHDGRMADLFDIDSVAEGGRWTLEGESMLHPLSPENQIVIANPLLMRFG